MSRSRTNFRILFATFGLAFGLFAAPATAQTLVKTSHFSLTYPAGWMNFTFPGMPDTTSATVMNASDSAISFLFGAPHQGDLTSTEIATALALAGAGDSLEVTVRGTKTLGSKSFTFIEWKKKNPATEEATSRFRVYYLVQNGFMFEAILSFTTDSSPTAVADIESALATLNVTAPTTLRFRISYGRRNVGTADLNLLGRTVRPDASNHVVVPLFSR